MFDLDFNSLSPASWILVILLAVVLFVLAVVTIRYRYLKHKTEVARLTQLEVSRRRRIRSTDKEMVFQRDNYTCQICGISRDFLDNLCPGLGDYLLLEADHVRSVKQGGTGRDIDNLQCLCWRCNRKKGGNKTNEEVRTAIDYGIEYLGDYYDEDQ